MRDFHPYSDYNFTSLYSWDIFDSILISRLNDNLVVKFNDYVTNKAFFSFIGINKVNTTAEILLKRSAEEGLGPLQLIPHSVAQEIDSSQLKVEEDRDQFDYIVAIDDQVNLSGERNHPKKRRIKKLLTSGAEIQDFALGKIGSHISREEISQVFEQWVKARAERGVDVRETENESKALLRLLGAKPPLDAEVFTITINGKMSAFFVGEELPNNYFIGHFEKADPDIEGLYQYLKHTVALNLQARGIKHMNIEQDLGIEGLRKAKLGVHPVHFLKKHTISFVAK